MLRLKGSDTKASNALDRIKQTVFNMAEAINRNEDAKAVLAAKLAPRPDADKASVPAAPHRLEAHKAVIRQIALEHDGLSQWNQGEAAFLDKVAARLGEGSDPTQPQIEQAVQQVIAQMVAHAGG
jgi:hypothetical protein